MAKKQKIKRNSDAPPLKVSYPLVVGGLFWFLLIFGAWQACRSLYSSNIFGVKSIACNVKLPPQVISSLSNKQIFSVNIDQVRAMLLASDSDFREVVVQKHFPSKIVIIVDKRRPFIQLKYSGHYTIDRDGVIIDSDSALDPNLLAVEVSDCPVAPVKGARVNSPQLDIARSLIAEMKRKDFFRDYTVESINVTTPESAYFSIRNKDPRDGLVQVIIGSDDFDHRLFIFDNLMFTKVKGDLHLVKYIDLRYKKAYVGYKR